MLDFVDVPYRYRPPLRSPVFVFLAGLYNRWRLLPRRLLITGVETSGVEELRFRLRSGDRLLILPNHPTHSDPQIMLEALRRAGLTSLFMAAYDVFERSRMAAAYLQYLGAFSVDREGSDHCALAQAIQTLREGRHAMTIFPEGKVFLQNDMVTPLHEGAAFIGLKAKEDVPEPVRAVPVSIKVTHETDVRQERMGRLKKIASDLGLDPPPAPGPLELLRHVGVAALLRNLRQRGIEVRLTGRLPEDIAAAAGEVLSRLEAKMNAPARPADPPIERVRSLRRAIHRIRTDPERAADHRAAAQWSDESMIAYRILSYSGNYVASNPTLDRFAETVEKLEEDVYGRLPTPYAPRHAIVRFGEPIDIAPGGRKLRAAVESLTERFEKEIQAGLDGLNAANRHAGGRPL